MQDGDFVLRESAAIVSYLADKYRGRGAIDLAPMPGTQVHKAVLMLASRVSYVRQTPFHAVSRRHAPSTTPGCCTS